MRDWIGPVAVLVPVLLAFWPHPPRRHPTPRPVRRPTVDRVRSPPVLLIGLVLAVMALVDRWATLLMVPALALGWWARRRADAARRHAALAANLAPTIDVVSVVLGSGGTALDAITALGRRGSPVVRRSAARTAGLAASGESLARALPTLSDDLGPDYTPLVRVLQASERDGIAVGDTLARLAAEALAARRRAAEIHARRLPVQLLVPLVVCLLPAVLVGAVLPLIMVGLDAVAA